MTESYDILIIAEDLSRQSFSGFGVIDDKRYADKFGSKCGHRISRLDREHTGQRTTALGCIQRRHFIIGRVRDSYSVRAYTGCTC